MMLVLFLLVLLACPVKKGLKSINDQPVTTSQLQSIWAPGCQVRLAHPAKTTVHQEEKEFVPLTVFTALLQELTTHPEVQSPDILSTTPPVSQPLFLQHRHLLI